MSKILIINGPNLNLLGTREPEIYGSQSFESYLQQLRQKYPHIQIDCYQTNHEGKIIDKLQEADNNYTGIILNAAAYTHTSIAISDTLKAINTPVVEVHISDLKKREKYRQISYISEAAVKVIMGEGLPGYDMAIRFLIEKYQTEQTNFKL